MARNQTYRAAGGAIIQAGLDARQPGAPLADMPPTTPQRAVVLKTYATDDDIRQENDSLRVKSVECDVILIKRQVVYSRVPVAQRGSGPNDASGLWIPVETTRSLAETESLSQVGGPGTAMTSFADMDGEHVLVTFMDDDPQLPVITHSLTHSAAKRVVVDGAGWDVSGGQEDEQRGKPEKDEHYLSHYGTELRINNEGDLLIDLKGAFADRVADLNNTENDPPGDGGGEFRIRIKDDKRFTVQVGGADVLEVWEDGGQVVIDLGEGATEKLARGDKLIAWLLAHVHPDAFGGTAAPLDLQGTTTLSIDVPSPYARVK